MARQIAGKRVGGLGLAGTFSFYANKIITTGEGGMITTNHAPLGRLMRRLRDHAFHPERHFWHEYVGFNYRMTNMQAAIGLAQTERMSEIVAARRRLRGWYEERLRPLARPGAAERGPGLPRRLLDVRHLHDAVVRLRSRRAAPAIGRSRHRDALVLVPTHVQPIYRDQFRDERYPVAERLCASGLYLPTHEALSPDEVNWICDQIAGDSGKSSEAIRAAE